MSRLLAMAAAANFAIPVFGQYQTNRHIDSVTGNLEHQCLLDGFHFASLVETPAGAVVFRPHPDPFEPDGWGSSVFLNPFLSGADANEASVEVISVNATSIVVAVSGTIAPTAGSFTWSASMSYDQHAMSVSGLCSLAVHLHQPLNGADLNLNRLSSNLLIDVFRQTTPERGHTGDMRFAEVEYHDNPTASFAWFPGPDSTTRLNTSLPIKQFVPHFPNDRASSLTISAIGELNTVDVVATGELIGRPEAAQINIARKPTLVVSYTATDDAKLLSFGGSLDPASQRHFEADNLGINHLVLSDNPSVTGRTNFTFHGQLGSSRILRPVIDRRSLRINSENLEIDVFVAGGADYVTERSIDLQDWRVWETNAAPSNRIHLRLPLDIPRGFVRLRGLGTRH